MINSMTKKHKPGLFTRLRERWHPVTIYQQLKSLFFAIIPKGSTLYSWIRSPLSIFLKKFNIINLYYRKWITQFDSPTEEELNLIRERIRNGAFNQAFSIIMPVFNPPPALLKEAIESVIRQVYPFWELCIADDASTDPRVTALLESYANKDDRIKVIFRKENGHISAASNSALEMASHEYIVLLDHDDVLHPLALHSVAETIQQHPDSVIVYSDEDKITKRGKRLDPYFKPDFDYELLLSQNMISHLGVYKTAVVRKVGGFRVGYEGSQDYDLALRVIECCQPEQIRHIPRPLYHWRLFRQSAARGLNVKPYTVDSAEKALSDHLARCGVDGSAHFLPGVSAYTVKYQLPEKKPAAGILIIDESLTQALINGINSILKETTYQPYHVYVNLKSDLPQENLKSTMWQEKVSFIQTDPDCADSFARRANACIHQIPSEIICLMAGTLNKFTPGWLAALVGQALQDGAGAVSPRLLTENERVFANGLILQPGGLIKHLSRGKDASDNGYFGWAKLSRGYSALPSECILFHRESFRSNKGFSENLHTPAASVVDFCLKLRQSGLRNILLPSVELYIYERDDAHKNSGIGPAAQEIRNQVASQWEGWFNNDPSFNPNLAVIDQGQIIIGLSPLPVKPED